MQFVGGEMLREVSRELFFQFRLPILFRLTRRQVFPFFQRRDQGSVLLMTDFREEGTLFLQPERPFRFRQGAARLRVDVLQAPALLVKQVETEPGRGLFFHQRHEVESRSTSCRRAL